MSGLPTAVARHLLEPAFPNHLTHVGDLSPQLVAAWCAHADKLRNLPRSEVMRRHSDKQIATLFYEPSTRTRLSFEAAALRLGAGLVSSENALENSSAKKGERLEDTLRVVGSYVDLIVIRHHEDSTLPQAVRVSPVPVVSAGTGKGEHPTQALLDMYTIYRELGRLDNLRITVLGDLRYGRTVHSLIRLLSRFTNIHVTVLPAPGLELPETLQREMELTGLRLRVAYSLQDAMEGADVVYQTRLQSERFEAKEPGEQLDRREAPQGDMRITTREMEYLSNHAILLHPLPRVDEIHPDVDEDPRAAYFRQVENGLYMRMAILDTLLTQTGEEAKL